MSGLKVITLGGGRNNGADKAIAASRWDAPNQDLHFYTTLKPRARDPQAQRGQGHLEWIKVGAYEYGRKGKGVQKNSIDGGGRGRGETNMGRS